jgi:hypothetical protein
MDGAEPGWTDGAEAGWAHFARTLDGIGERLWRRGERDAAIDLRRDAYAAYRLAGDARAAGGLATHLASEHRIGGEDAKAAAWMARARRLLADLDTGAEHGWLAVEDAERAIDPLEAERSAREGLEIAQGLADPDIECMALVRLGTAVVRQGRLAEGTALLDNAAAIARERRTQPPRRPPAA